MARKATRTFHIPITSTHPDQQIAPGVGRTFQPGEPVPLDHLSDADYDHLMRLYPEEMSPAEAKRVAADRAAAARATAREGA